MITTGPTSRRRTGRPRHTPEPRSEKLYFRVTPSELAEIQDRAFAAGYFEVSAFAREMVKAGKVRRRLRQARYSPEIVGQLRRAGNNINQYLVEARRRNFPPSVADAAEDALQQLSTLLRGLLHGPEH